MIESGLKKITPDPSDYSLVHTYGAIADDAQGLPAQFSIYNGEVIPDQRKPDIRFTPALRPLPYGCTGESQSFIGGLQDNALYRPDDLYDNTKPFVDGEGRDMRDSLQTTIDRGYKSADGTLGNKRKRYFNCYGSGKIDDFDAARIGVWINQAERRAVTVGLWWYPEFDKTDDGTVPLPSFNTNKASLHNVIITGWRTTNGVEEVEVISWQGMKYGKKGLCYIPRPIYNALMEQPWTASFTLTKLGPEVPVVLGAQVWIDHLVYWIRNLFRV